MFTCSLIAEYQARIFSCYAGLCPVLVCFPFGKLLSEVNLETRRVRPPVTDHPMWWALLQLDRI